MISSIRENDAGQVGDAVKTCLKCDETKSVGEFHKSGYTKKDGTQSLDSWCKTCRNEYQKRYPGRAAKYAAKPANKEKISTRMKAHYQDNKEKLREKSRKWREDHKDEMKERYKKWRKGKDRFQVALLTSAKNAKKHGYAQCISSRDEVAALWTGKCNICGVPQLELKRSLCLDHCHESGRARGFLCHKCNSALGMFNDSEELLIDALHYIMQKQEST